MPAKPRRLADLSDDEFDAEAKRRAGLKKQRTARRIPVVMMSEEEFEQRFGSGKSEDDDTDDTDEGEEEEDEGGTGYFS